MGFVEGCRRGSFRLGCEHRLKSSRDGLELLLDYECQVFFLVALCLILR